ERADVDLHHAWESDSSGRRELSHGGRPLGFLSPVHPVVGAHPVLGGDGEQEARHDTAGRHHGGSCCEPDGCCWRRSPTGIRPTVSAMTSSDTRFSPSRPSYSDGRNRPGTSRGVPFVTASARDSARRPNTVTR